MTLLTGVRARRGSTEYTADGKGGPGTGKPDRPKHTIYRGRPVWENPTYSAFWSLFGVSCPRLQRLASSVGFREDGAIGTPEEPAIFRRNT